MFARHPRLDWSLAGVARSRVCRVSFSPTADGVQGVQQSGDHRFAAAVRCLARDGYSASSIADRRQAGVRKAMVLYYFKSREQLFDVVIRRIGDRLIGQVEARR